MMILTSFGGKTPYRNANFCFKSSIGGILAVAGLLLVLPASPQAGAAGRPVPPAALAGAKRSISDVEEFVKGVASGLITEDEAIEKINERGVDFFATPANLARLRSSGATERILRAIQTLAPEPVKPTAALALTCTPAECTIKLNGVSAGSTKDGRFQKSGMELGHVDITFEKEGYVPEQKSISLSAADTYTASANLQPNDATRHATGKALFLLTRRALGIESDVKPIRVLNGGGAITSFASGKQTDWNFDFTMTQPNLIEMKVESSAGALVYQCQGQKCAEKKKKRSPIGLISGGKQIKGPALEELQTNLRAFAQYNLAEIIETLADPSAQYDSLTANAESKTDQKLRVETADAIYNVTIGPDQRPSDIDYQSKSGLGSGLKVLFAAFTMLGDAQYPKRTTIRFPDTAQHGIEVRLDHLSPGSELKESDFAK